jgi:hypothetical protein
MLKNQNNEIEKYMRVNDGHVDLNDLTTEGTMKMNSSVYQK